MKILLRLGIVCALVFVASTQLRADSWELGVGALSYTENGTAYTIDFTSLPDYTQVTSSTGVTFGLQYSDGATGIAETGWGDALSNSPTGEYPTSEYLDIFFTSGAEDVSFTFDNFGEGNGSYYNVYTGSATVAASGNLDSLSHTGACDNDFCTVALSDTGISEIQISNNVTDDGPSTAPEPGTLTLLSGGLLGLCGFARRKFARA